ncbi:hypothetical protein BH11ARM2_BH11ARM2_29620 [soil metagenome]
MGFGHGKEAQLDVWMQGWIHPERGSVEKIGFMEVFPSQKPPEDRVVRLFASGDCFTMDGDQAKAVRVQASLRSRFEDLCGWFRPLYGAITVDYEMETPAELRNDPRSVAFHQFYWNPEAMPAKIVEQILDRFSSQFVHRQDSGIFVYAGDLWPGNKNNLSHTEPGLKQGIGDLLAKLPI